MAPRIRKGAQGLSFVAHEGGEKTRGGKRID
jgi:hypothetical protein